MVLPKSSPRRVELLAGICWNKSQIICYSPGMGGGGGGMVSNDWCINASERTYLILIIA